MEKIKMKNKMMILFLVVIMVFCMPITSMALTDADIEVDESNVTALFNDFDGEMIIDTFVEDGNLYVVTASSTSLPPGGGQCPSITKTITTSVNRSDLVQWKKDGKLEEKVKNVAIGAITSAFSLPVGIATSAIGPFSSGLVKDCEKILDTSTKSKFNVNLKFRCSDKMQVGDWYHIWTLTGVSVV